MAKSKTKTPPVVPPVTARTGDPTVNKQLQEAEQYLSRFEGALNEAYAVRSQYLRELMDPRRNINHDCGFPDHPTIDHFQQLFDRNPFAQRVVEVMAREAFQVTPKVTDQTEEKKPKPKTDEALGDLSIDPEDDEINDEEELAEIPVDPTEVTNAFPGEDDEGLEEEIPEGDEENPFGTPPPGGPKAKPTAVPEEKKESKFDKDWRTLGSKIKGTKSWHRDDEGSAVLELLMRAVIQANICQYGVIVIGLNDGMEPSEPVAGVEEANSEPQVVSDKKDPKSGKYEIPITPVTNDYGGKQVIKSNGRKVLWSDPYKNTVTTNTERVIRPYSLRIDPVKAKSVLTVNAETGETERVEGERKILYANAFSESSAMVTRWESNRTSPRYGQPVSYLITYNSPWNQAGYATTAPSHSENVHWTRVIHIPGRNVQSSNVVSQPEMGPVLNDLLTLDKVRAAMGEGYWKSAFPGLALSTHPELGKTVKVDRTDLKNQIENYENTLSRVLVLMGMSASTLPPTMVDPTPYIEMLIQSLCIKIAIPKRIFMGSERGELSSGQDEGDWNDKLAAYWRQYLIPRAFVPFIDRMILLQAMTEPKEYRIDVPDMDAQNAKEKADVALVITQAMVAAIGAGLFESGLIDKRSWLVKVCKFDEADVDEWMAKAEEDELAAQDEMDMFGEEQGFKPLAPDGMVDPEERDMQHEVEMAKAKNPGKPGFGGGPPPPNGKPKPAFGGRL